MTTITGTASYRTPTEEEAKKKIIQIACWYCGKKWYEPKAYLLKQLKEWCEVYSMSLSTIIEKKKKEFRKKCHTEPKFFGDITWIDTFLEKAIRESVEEALREVRGLGIPDFDNRVKEFMK